MAFFDKIAAIAQSAADNTKTMFEVNKLNSNINGEKLKITEIKCKIGEYYWTKFLANGQNDLELADLFAQIEACETTIAATQAEIQTKKDEANRMAVAAEPVRADEKRCLSCNTVNPEGIKFCQGCGSKLETPAKPVNNICACGAQNALGTKFCGECGERLEKEGG